MKIIVSALLAILLLSSACSPSLVPIQPPDLDEVTEFLGYSLAPTHMPEGFVFRLYDITEFGTDGNASIVYERLHLEGDYESSYQYIFIMYPYSFTSPISDNPLVESLLPEWQRPDDSVTEVRVNGEKAHLVDGSWSRESQPTWVIPGQVLATFIPEWDYDTFLNLYFDYKLPSGETVAVMIRAIFDSSEWITTTELVKIAESMALVN